MKKKSSRRIPVKRMSNAMRLILDRHNRQLRTLQGQLRDMESDVRKLIHVVNQAVDMINSVHETIRGLDG